MSELFLTNCEPLAVLPFCDKQRETLSYIYICIHCSLQHRISSSTSSSVLQALIILLSKEIVYRKCGSGQCQLITRLWKYINASQTCVETLELQLLLSGSTQALLTLTCSECWLSRIKKKHNKIYSLYHMHGLYVSL